MGSQVYNVDCAKYMKDIPDGYFDLCVADPPYGINITGRHRSQFIQVERERTGRRSWAAPVDLSAVHGDCGRGRQAPFVTRIQGAAKSSKSNQTFIQCLTIAPRQTRMFSGSLNV